jgi:NAD+ synthase (glutamine-hydrolysing)
VKQLFRYGFIRVAAAIPEVQVADCEYNTKNIIEMIFKAASKAAKFVVFPELSMTAYSCGDLFHQNVLIKTALSGLEDILHKTKDLDIISIVGMPLYIDGKLFNCAVVIHKGKILGAIPKIYIRNTEKYNEERWFVSGLAANSNYIRLINQEVPFGTNILFSFAKDRRLCFGVEISGDLWAPVSPSTYHGLSGASIVFNLSATVEEIGLTEKIKGLIKTQSTKCNTAYVYTSSGAGESTTDGVYSGYGVIIENGVIQGETKEILSNKELIFADVDIGNLAHERLKNIGFIKGMAQFSVDNNVSSWMNPNKYREICFNLKELCQGNIEPNDPWNKILYRYIAKNPFMPCDKEKRNERCKEVFEIQTAGIVKRLEHTGSKHAIIGVSGGLDSTLALLVIVNAFDKMQKSREGIIGVTMPGFGTTKITYENAIKLMTDLGISTREIDIKPACLQHFSDIGHKPDIYDTTYENVQARERYQILMDIANKEGGLVIGTGDLSELALGWCTYNGDHMSMYNVNCGVPKTIIGYLINWIAENKVTEVSENIKETLYKITSIPISPELLPPMKDGEIKQKTEDIIGPYELHDFFLYHAIKQGMSPKKVVFLAEYAFKDKYDKDTIKKWMRVFLKRFFSQQFKRSCMPDGPRIFSISLSPRGGLSMPSDARGNLWLNEIDEE